ncbi:acetyl-CoA carboxylase biotin carboxylase subunit [Bosea sp. (in: a-proteobacteria)]|uniref:acetyl/propionyl/methylcrotonyl-CoA carboxylase subunit alpha n=1 Tax=Bosea sp. (in: a-proteobacteria) TaxID=1871050 RepID=UPI00260E5689|nr:acetyl-CoA carboxylase biotin carboxylase subunit [Bosea sp. (in: a-proteobacteria)]MCO5089656.1 acetyl-CoA carboxylase biotin carboxylase subunit [Bosea sp. (in: a-proteobacteria)]
MTTASPPLARRFTKLLIANRGEIACRIIRTASRMGLQTVAVYSEADKDAEHVSLADEAVWIGPAAAAESYLRIDRVIAAARRTGAGAIHPGYGFLSENQDFAIACREAGLVFVGPPVEAIRAMASKAAAKTLMETSGVPLVPGYHGAEQDVEKLAAEAARIGFPVLVKASAGGGGKGMRIAEDATGIAAAIGAAKREAQAAFGDDHVLIEKFIMRPRHIEVQIFGDTHGNVVSLFERECTLQRRHQKVVEEAPSSSLTEAERERICSAARAAGAAVGYTGAGTVEFVANEDGFYFIEMNTRLQVEHPVTEMITGLDLVEWQLRVAFGEALPLAQDEITRRGHAVEVRIYAEDPQSGFLPSIGRIESWRQPAAGPGIRIDSGFREGDTITPYYDPMLAKLIVGGADRLEAFSRLQDALAGFQVAGVRSNVAFLKALVAHPAVRAGTMDTGFIERELPQLLAQGEGGIDERDLAAAAAAFLARLRKPAASPWDSTDGWTIIGRRRLRLVFDDIEIAIDYRRDGLILATPGGARAFRVNVRTDGRLDVFHGDGKEVVSAVWLGREVEVSTARGSRRFTLADPFAGTDAAAVDAGHVRAPMPGSVTHVLAAPGDRMKRGDPLLVIEAMKMEHMLRAPADGRLVMLRCAVGDFVQEGTDLVEFEIEAMDE